MSKHALECIAFRAVNKGLTSVDTSTKTVILDRATGKIAYGPSISFGDAKIHEAFGEAVWRAVETFAPDGGRP